MLDIASKMEYGLQISRLEKLFLWEVVWVQQCRAYTVGWPLVYCRELAMGKDRWGGRKGVVQLTKNFEQKQSKARPWPWQVRTLALLSFWFVFLSFWERSACCKNSQGIDGKRGKIVRWICFIKSSWNRLRHYIFRFSPTPPTSHCPKRKTRTITSLSFAFYFGSLFWSEEKEMEWRRLCVDNWFRLRACSSPEKEEIGNPSGENRDRNTEIQVPETSQELRVLSSVTFNRLPPYQLQV